MLLYTPSVENDTLMMAWWHMMMGQGEVHEVFAEEALTPSGFLGMLRRVSLLYHADDEGMAVVIFFEPFMAGALLGFWVRPDWRRVHRSESWKMFIDTMKIVLEYVPVVMFMTKRRHVVQTAISFGFTILGKVPSLYGGHDATLGYMTREMFEESYERIT